MPKIDAPEYSTRIQEELVRVLGKGTGENPVGHTYDDEEKELFPLYRYLFVDGSKPTTHLLALAKLEEDVLWKLAPEFLRRLVERARKRLEGPTEEP